MAIKKAIQNAETNEVILIAGKGHEEKQIYRDKIINISDKKIVKKINIKIKNLSEKKQNFLQNKLIIKNILGKTKSVNFDGLSIDTRTIKKDNLFLALKGKKTDGSSFFNTAIKKGAGCIITSSNVKKNNKKIIKVKNTISFLNQFAKEKREKSMAKIL